MEYPGQRRAAMVRQFIPCVLRVIGLLPRGCGLGRSPKVESTYALAARKARRAVSALALLLLLSQSVLKLFLHSVLCACYNRRGGACYNRADRLL